MEDKVFTFTQSKLVDCYETPNNKVYLFDDNTIYIYCWIMMPMTGDETYSAYNYFDNAPEVFAKMMRRIKGARSIKVIETNQYSLEGFCEIMHPPGPTYWMFSTEHETIHLEVDRYRAMKPFRTVDKDHDSVNNQIDKLREGVDPKIVSEFKEFMKLRTINLDFLEVNRALIEEVIEELNLGVIYTMSEVVYSFCGQKFSLVTMRGNDKEVLDRLKVNYEV